MSFKKNVAYAAGIGEIFGLYRSTFRSRTGQVLAQLFEQNNGWLIAYVSFSEGLKPEKVKDNYVGDLKQYANQHGFTGKLKLIYCE